jgi:hypothetical protein
MTRWTSKLRRGATDSLLAAFIAAAPGCQEPGDLESESETDGPTVGAADSTDSIDGSCRIVTRSIERVGSAYRVQFEVAASENATGHVLYTGPGRTYWSVRARELPELSTDESRVYEARVVRRAGSTISIYPYLRDGDGRVFDVNRTGELGIELDRSNGFAYTDPNTCSQGWSRAVVQEWYETDQGGGLLPYDIFVALEQAESEELFVTPENLERFGFLYDESYAADRLPIGVVKVQHSDGSEWMSLTCAGCHTSVVTHEGATMRIEGGANLLDADAFFAAAADAVEEPLSDEGKLARLAARLGEDPANVAASLSSLRPNFVSFARFLVSGAGPGRMDTTNSAYNTLTCISLGLPENCRQGSTPSATPPLWGVNDLDLVQTNGNQHIPVVRDMLQALIWDRVAMRSDGSVEHHLNLAGIKRLGGLLDSLKAPRWNERVLGEIDMTLAEEGAAIYASECSSCHSNDPHPMTAANKFGRQFIETPMIPMAEMGTDPGYINTFLGRNVVPGPLAPIFAARPELGMVSAQGTINALSPVRVLFGGILNGHLATLSDAEKVAFLDQRESKTFTVQHYQSFRARPLDGVAFSGPFLHNGTVRTLYQLLLPAAEREREFRVGSREYDPAHLGYVSEGEYVLRTGPASSAPYGSANGGHEYATDLTQAQRLALLEYLKTL